MSTTTKQQNEPKIEEIEASYQEICRQLNMDKETERTAWQNYFDASQNCTLQGDPFHWLCCAIYAACRESYTPTVGNADAVVAGNCVSLTKLLRSCNISINEFCNKIRLWANVRNVSKGLRAQIERLEQSFNVSLCVYKKYEEIFPKLFVISSAERKKKKAKPGPCSASKLYDFCWCLFIAAKGEEPNRRTDLVSSLHLLLCSIDLIFVNAVFDDRRDIIKADFAGLPKNWNSDNFDSTTLKDFCIIRQLCEIVSADFLEVANLKRTIWKSVLTKLTTHKTLLCNSPSDIISNTYFEPNLKSLNNSYEQYCLSVGEFDERIFLSSEKDRTMPHSVTRSLPSTPVSSAATKQWVQSLADKGPPIDFAKTMEEDDYQIIESRMDNLEKEFIEKFNSVQKCAGQENLRSPEMLFKNSKALYYYFLEKIIANEKKIKPQLDCKIIFGNNTLHKTLLACCVEIIIYLHGLKLEFPWVLECFELDPYYFYRIIEIVVQNNETILDRSTISHLNTIESSCIDNLAWQRNSLLWGAIEKMKEDKGTIPSYDDVDPRNKGTNGSSCRKEESRLQGSFFQSPSTGAQYMKPTEASESARRDLFNAGPSGKSNRESLTETTPPKPRAGSLNLFFRKFYELAYKRMSKLYQGLDMKDSDLLDSIWTIFEYCIMTKTEIMRDRHLDQIIMCTIYVLIKVKDIPGTNFTGIMQTCRQQLKTTSSMYRQVLLDVVDGRPRYGDIIQFYNTVYVKSVSPFALSYADKSKKENHLLSPHPPDRLQSPKQIPNCQFYVQTLDKKDIPHSPGGITYEINKSPGKDLQKINALVNGKRHLLDESAPHQQKKHCEKKLFEIIRDRQMNNPNP